MSTTGIRAQKKAMRPAEILSATFLEFSEKGYDNARIEDIAARLGVTKGTIYFYFPTKQDLFASMIRDLSCDLTASMGGMPKAGLSYRDQLRDFISRFFHHLALDSKGREVLRFMIADGAKFPDLVEAHRAEFIEPLFDICRDIVRNGVQAGEFRPEVASLPPEIILGPTLSMTLSLLMFRDSKALELDDYLALYLEALLNGISVSP